MVHKKGVVNKHIGSMYNSSPRITPHKNESICFELPIFLVELMKAGFKMSSSNLKLVEIFDFIPMT
jgi:hypothetical protein